MKLTLDDQQIKQLDTYLGEIPAKYSVQPILWLSQLVQDQNAPQKGSDSPSPETSLKVVKD